MLKRDKTKKLILDTAIVLFKAKGIQKTSVEDIVKRSKVAKGTFFYHFPQKDQIVFEIITIEFDGYFKAPEEIEQNNTLYADEKMSKVLVSIFSIFKTPTVLEQMFRLGVSPQFELYINKIRLKKLIPLITSIIKQGNQEGIFDVKNIDVISSIVNRGIVAHIHIVYDSLMQGNTLQLMLSGIEELVNNVLKTNKKIHIAQNY